MSTPAHTMLSVQQFLTKNSMAPMLHITYSLALALSNFVLFPWMKKVLKGNCFADVEEVKQKAAALKAIKINGFKNCFEQWKERLDR